MDMSHKLPIINDPPEQDEAASDVAIDPVCGMKVDKRTAKLTLKRDGQDYYFCSRSCLDKFAADPEKFLGAAWQTIAGCDPARRCLHVPDASGSSAARSGKLPEVWDGARTGVAHRRGGASRVYLPDASGDRAQMRPAVARSVAWHLSRARSRPTDENPELADMSRRFWVSCHSPCRCSLIAMAHMVFARSIA